MLLRSWGRQVACASKVSVRLQGQRAREIMAYHLLPFAAPARCVLWQPREREADGIEIETRVDAAASMKAALRIGLVEIVDDTRGLNALEFVQRVFENPKRLKAAVDHQVLAYQAAGVGQPLGEPAGFRHQQQSRRFASVGADHHGLGPLEDFAPIRIEVDRAPDPAIRSGLDLARIRIRADFAAPGALRDGDYGPQRARFRPHLTAEALAEAAVHAGAAAAIRLRENRHGSRKRMQAKLAGGAFENHAGRLHRQRRQRIRLGAPRFERVRASQTGDAQFLFGLRVIWL